MQNYDVLCWYSSSNAAAEDLIIRTNNCIIISSISSPSRSILINVEQLELGDSTIDTQPSAQLI